MEDEQIRNWVNAAMAGDLESFGKLCSHHHRAFVAVAYAILGDHHLAEDAAQHAYAKALTNLRRLRRPERFASWLACIVRNVAIDMFRIQARYGQQVPLENVPAGSIVDKDTTDTDAVRRAVAQLRPGLRELIVLRYYDGMSYRQISAISGLSQAAINCRLARAKQKIAKQLKLDGVLEIRS